MGRAAPTTGQALVGNEHQRSQDLGIGPWSSEQTGGEVRDGDAVVLAQELAQRGQCLIGGLGSRQDGGGNRRPVVVTGTGRRGEQLQPGAVGGTPVQEALQCWPASDDLSQDDQMSGAGPRPVLVVDGVDSAEDAFRRTPTG